MPHRSERLLAAPRATALAVALAGWPAGSHAQTAWEALQSQAAQSAAAPVSAVPSIPAVADETLPAPKRKPEAGCAGDPIDARIAAALGMGSPCRVRKEHLGHAVWNSTEKFTFGDGRREVSVALKHFGAVSSMRWRWREGMFSFRRVVTGRRNLYENELAMKAAFREAGLKTPDLVAAFPKERILVARFLEGAVSMTKFVHRALEGDDAALAPIELLGRRIADVHRNGLCVEDLGLGNTMLQDGDLYFVDLDQASRGGRRGWDIAEFLYETAKDSHNSDAARGRRRWAAVAHAFLSGYLADGGDAAVVREALDPVYAEHYGWRALARGVHANPEAMRLIRAELEAAAAGKR